MTTTVGDIKNASNAKRAICLMTAQTGNKSAPSSSTAGVPCYPTTAQILQETEVGAFLPGLAAQDSTLVIDGTVNAGQTLVGTFTLWGYLAASDTWHKIPVNGGSALSETGTDVINYSEQFSNLGHYDRLDLSLASIGGTGASFQAWLITSRTVSF